MCNYQKVIAEFENVFMYLVTNFFAITKGTVLFKICFKSLVFSKQNAIVHTPRLALKTFFD